jgi:cyclopropane-fatty-acyl-phospholipid synthase
MDGWWDCERLDEMSTRVHATALDLRMPRAGEALLKVKEWLVNRQSERHSSRVARRHYDLGNDLFETMLDPHMQYTCAYWKNAATLNSAQEDKLDLIARKLHLQPGMRVLDLGSGFGGLARWLARNCGCEVVSYNISQEQVAYARDICRGLPVRVEQADYREAIRERTPFDRIAAIGLCEHIGRRNYPSFFDLAAQLIAHGGLFLVHAIGANRSWFTTDPWVDKYIFPNGVMPSIQRLGAAMENGWVMEDWHNFGPDYDRTLLAWWQNFDAGWPSLRERYGDRFYRMWKYYVLTCAGAFRARTLQLWQIVLSRGDIPSYEPVR